MSGVYKQGFDEPPDPQIGQILRAALISAQHLMRERFENRVAWVDGHWQWRRERTPADPPLPAEARKKIADVSRLFEILTNAQFQDHSQQPQQAESHKIVDHKAPAQQINFFDPALSGHKTGFSMMSVVGPAILSIAAFLVFCSIMGRILERPGVRRRTERLKQWIHSWFSKKGADAAHGNTESSAPPRHDPPPPYDNNAAPFLPPADGGDLPPPYCDTHPDKANSINDQLQTLLEGSSSVTPEQSNSETTEAGKTEECENSGRERVSGDDSRVVVV